jgi:hypothetical protein
MIDRKARACTYLDFWACSICPTSSKNYFNFNRIIEGLISMISIMLYTKGINPSVKNFRSLTDSIDHRWKKFDFCPIVSIHQLLIFFLLTTIDLIDVVCRQSIIGIDPIDVFFTIGAQLWLTAITIRSHNNSYDCRSITFRRNSFFYQLRATNEANNFLHSVEALCNKFKMHCSIVIIGGRPIR